MPIFQNIPGLNGLIKFINSLVSSEYGNNIWLIPTEFNKTGIKDKLLGQNKARIPEAATGDVL